MIINVTENHIKQGKKHSCHANPICLAISEQNTYNGVLFASSSIVSNKVFYAGKVFEMDEEMKQWLDDFDFGIEVKAKSFNIPIIESQEDIIERYDNELHFV